MIAVDTNAGYARNPELPCLTMNSVTGELVGQVLAKLDAAVQA